MAISFTPEQLKVLSELGLSQKDIEDILKAAQNGNLDSIKNDIKSKIQKLSNPKDIEELKSPIEKEQDGRDAYNFLENIYDEKHNTVTLEELLDNDTTLAEEFAADDVDIKEVKLPKPKEGKEANIDDLLNAYPEKTRYKIKILYNIKYPGPINVGGGFVIDTFFKIIDPALNLALGMPKRLLWFAYDKFKSHFEAKEKSAKEFNQEVAQRMLDFSHKYGLIDDDKKSKFEKEMKEAEKAKDFEKLMAKIKKETKDKFNKEFDNNLKKIILNNLDDENKGLSKAGKKEMKKLIMMTMELNHDDENLKNQHIDTIKKELAEENINDLSTTLEDNYETAKYMLKLAEENMDKSIDTSLPHEEQKEKSKEIAKEKNFLSSLKKKADDAFQKKDFKKMKLVLDNEELQDKVKKVITNDNNMNKIILNNLNSKNNDIKGSEKYKLNELIQNLNLVGSPTADKISQPNVEKLYEEYVEIKEKGEKIFKFINDNFDQYFETPENTTDPNGALRPLTDTEKRKIKKERQIEIKTARHNFDQSADKKDLNKMKDLLNSTTIKSMLDHLMQDKNLQKMSKNAHKGNHSITWENNIPVYQANDRSKRNTKEKLDNLKEIYSFKENNDPNRMQNFNANIEQGKRLYKMKQHAEIIKQIQRGILTPDFLKDNMNEIGE